MKKFYVSLCTAALLIPGMLVAQKGGNKDLLAGPYFSTDVTVEGSGTIDLRNARITSAFNGWMYAAYTTRDNVNDKGGIVIERSKDYGFTWAKVDSYAVTSVIYEDVEIEVAGTDTNNLTLYLCGINHSTAGPGNYVAFVDKYNATSGVFITSIFNRNTSTRRINDLDMATDYEWPGVGASPYSLGLLVSEYTSSQDSINFFASVDGGTSFTIHAPVATTGGYFDQVTLSYGRSNSGSNGRYFGAWEQRSTFSNRTGHIYTSRSVSQVNSPSWIGPICLDSVSSTMINLCRNPRMATQYNDTDNDSGSVTAIVLVDRDYNGDATDYDLLGFYNKRAHYTNFWYRLDVLNSGENDMQPDLVYSTSQSMFYGTYMDSTNHKLTYVTNNMNLTTPNTWTYVSNQYNDDSTVTRNAYPRVAYNPTGSGFAAVWTDEGAGGMGIIKFDAEFLGVYVSTPTVDPLGFQVNAYPNPTTDVLNLNIRVEDAAEVQYSVMDLSGRLMYQSTPVQQYAGASIYQLDVSGYAAGQYIIRLNVGGETYTEKMMVVK